MYYRLLFGDLLQFFEDNRRERMVVAVLLHLYDLTDLAVHLHKKKEEKKKKKTCLGETMDRKATTVWPLWPAAGGAPKRGSKILQELHVYAHRDVR